MTRLAWLLTLVFGLAFSSLVANETEEAHETKVAHDEFLGAWVLDNEASIAFAKKGADWTTKEEQQFSLLLAMNESMTYQFNEQTVIIDAGDESLVVEITSSEKRGTGIEMILQKTESSTVISLRIENGKQLHISGDNSFAFDRLLWKRK